MDLALLIVAICFSMFIGLSAISSAYGKTGNFLDDFASFFGGNMVLSGVALIVLSILNYFL